MSGLVERYDGIVCDLDGVVYRGPDPVEHAVDVLGRIRASGRGIVYATNNASRPPAAVAEHLRNLGVTCEAGDVVNSAQAGARIVAEQVPAGATVLAVGGEGVRLALEEHGLRAVVPHERAADPSIEVAAVLQGYGPDIAWADLAEAAYAITAGAVWVATNTDLSIPTARGIAPGNGSLVRAVGCAVTAEPIVAGKPRPPLYLACAERLGTQPARLLAVGDRLDTDIEGANRAGLESILVLTGVDDVVGAACAPTIQRPTYVGTDPRDLFADMPDVTLDGLAWRCGSASAWVDDDRVSVDGIGIEAVRAALQALWSATDDGARPDGPTPADREVLAELQAGLDRT